MDTNDLEGRKKKRITIGAHLIIGEDDDLIQWAETYQNGERNAAIKATLRLGLGIEYAVKVEVGIKGRPRQHVNSLAQLPDELMARLEQLEHENRLLQEYKDYNEQRWQVWEQGGPERPAEPIESIPDLDSEVKADRTQKLKRTSW